MRFYKAIIKSDTGAKYCDLYCGDRIIVSNIQLSDALKIALGMMDYGDQYFEANPDGTKTEYTGLIEGLLTEASVQAFQNGHNKLAKDIFNLITKYRNEL